MSHDERHRSPEDDAPTISPLASRTPAERAATCPFVRTLLVQHPEIYDESSRTMSLEALLEFVRGQRPTPARDHTSLEQVFAFFARSNQTPLRLWLKNLMRGSDMFSTDFPGSRGDHPGSTGIYREEDGAFDAEAFERVVAHSSDGVTMSHRDVAAAIVEANRRPENPGSAVDLVKSAGEFALLFNVIGTADDRLRITDMRTLFEQNAWPPDALGNLGRARAADWQAATRALTACIVDITHAGHDHDVQMAEAMARVDSVFDAAAR